MYCAGSFRNVDQIENLLLEPFFRRGEPGPIGWPTRQAERCPRHHATRSILATTATGN